MPMTTDRHVLTLAQWLSPAFPVGAFAYSHGLEVAIADRRIESAADLEGWLEVVLVDGSGRNDCILLRAAHAAGKDADALALVNAMACANVACAERLQETALQGEAFCRTVSNVWQGELKALTYPVGVGAAAQRLGMDPQLTAAMYLHAFVGNLVSAAVRAVPLGQTEGQAVLAALMPLCEEIAATTENLGVDDLSSTAFLSDIAAMRHETLQPRIFRT